MYRDGTLVEALSMCDEVTGRLCGDHPDLDGLVTLATTERGILRLNGWLWVIVALVPDRPA